MTTGKEFTPFEPTIRHKEIDLIQSIITRMADNQFKVKGFCITILGFFLYGLKDHAPCWQLGLSSFIVLFGCYFLDLSYLQAEKLFRLWFDFLQRKRSETNEWFYLLNPKDIKQILKEQRVVWDEYNPDKIEERTKRGWSLKFFYLALFFILCVFYLPTCFAASSIQLPM